MAPGFTATILLLLNFYLVTSVRIDISPDTCIATMENAVRITCTPDSVGDESKEITVMKISRNDDDTMAILRHCNNITYGTHVSSNLQADGYIDIDARLSYLNLTLMDPKSEDSGIYTCVMYYLDDAGHVMEEASSTNLVVQKLDIETLETTLNDLKERVRTAESKCEKNTQELIDKDAVLMTKLETLEAQDKNQTQQIDHLTNTSYFSPAFSVYNSHKFKPKEGDVLILPDIMMVTKGEEYNPKTGVFSAPIAGLYSFHISLRMSCTGCSIKLEFLANSNVFGKLYVGDSDYEDQASLSTLVALKTGDKVKMVVTYCSGLVHYDKYTTYSGYLLRAYSNHQ